MKFTTSLTIDRQAQHKTKTIYDLVNDLNIFFKGKNYGEGIMEYFLIIQIVNPPLGFEQMYKEIKPKFIDQKLLINKITGEKIFIEKQFSYSIKIHNQGFEEFITATEVGSRKMLLKEIINSTSNFEKLTKSIKNFDIEKFKIDLIQFNNE